MTKIKTFTNGTFQSKVWEAPWGGEFLASLHNEGRMIIQRTFAYRNEAEFFAKRCAEECASLDPRKVYAEQKKGA